MAKKKTTKKKCSQAKSQPTPHNILQNCVANGVVYDKASMEAIQDIADALCENAKALGQLASVLKPTSVTIGSLISMG